MTRPSISAEYILQIVVRPSVDCRMPERINIASFSGSTALHAAVHAHGFTIYW